MILGSCGGNKFSLCNVCFSFSFSPVLCLMYMYMLLVLLQSNLMVLLSLTWISSQPTDLPWLLW